MCVHPGYIFMQGACDAHVSTLATYESTSVLVLMISGQATLPTCVAPILGRGSCKLCLYFTTQVHSSHLYFITITTHVCTSLCMFVLHYASAQFPLVLHNYYYACPAHISRLSLHSPSAQYLTQGPPPSTPHAPLPCCSSLK